MKSAPLIPWWLLLPLGLTILALVVVLAGCATEAELASRTRPLAVSYPPTWDIRSDVQNACRRAGAAYLEGDIIHGCAEWAGRLNPSRCTIIVPPNPPQWLIDHELLHCKYGAFH